MLPLAMLLPPTKGRPSRFTDGVRALATFAVDREEGAALTAPEGRDGGSLTIDPRRRPVRPPRALLQDLWRRTWDGTPRAARALALITLEGDHAVLASATGPAGAAWVGIVVGDDFLYTVEGTATAPHAERLGQVTAALVTHASLGLGERRPRAYLHRPPGTWTARVRATGETVWRDGPGTITAYPAVPIRSEAAPQFVHRRLCGDPFALLREARLAGGEGVRVRTRGGLEGFVVTAPDEHVAVLSDGTHHYPLTLRGVEHEAARRAFALTLDGIEPLPTLGPAPVTVADPWCD